MVIARGDKVVLTKEHAKLNHVGETYEIGDITGTSVIIRNPKNKVAVAAFGVDEFYEYFSACLVGWTPWTAILIAVTEGDFDRKVMGSYRTNGKKVQVKIHHKYKGESCCSKYDDFSLYIGVNIAMCRAYKKYIEKAIENTIKDIENANKNLNTLESQFNEMDCLIDKYMKQVKSKPVPQTGTDTGTNTEV